MGREARFRGTCGVEVRLPARGDMRILHVISYSRLGLAASGDMRIFLDWWVSCTNIYQTFILTVYPEESRLGSPIYMDLFIPGSFLSIDRYVSILIRISDLRIRILLMNLT